MRLKKIELFGFKTFATRSALEFAPGITAVVGPNGSGKSNVTDGVRWVLGEQSMRLLRGRRSEDVIFAGGAGRAPAGMAEVTLTLDNSDGELPPEFAEVSIGRRAYRSGESEYYLNRSKVRLRDVVDLLSRAGIGQNGHSVIGQGLVDQALSQRPEERRSLFEDAAGMRRYQAKKAEAETKLAEVHANATRVADLMAELEPRLAQLSRQARRAQDEARLREQWTVAARRLMAHQRHEIEVALAEWEPSLARLQAIQAEATAESGASAAAFAAARERLAQLRQGIESFEAEQTAARERVDTLRREAAVAGERMAGAERSAAELRGAVARLEARVAVGETALPDTERALGEARQRVADAREELDAAEAALRSAPEIGDPQAAQAAREDLIVRARELTQAVTQLREAERQLREVTRQSAESAEGRDRATAALESHRAALSRVERELTERQARAETLAQAHGAAHAAHGEARERADAAARRQASHAREVNELRVRLDVLRGVVRGDEHAPHDATERSARVAEQLRVPAELEAAVAAALGPALDWIVLPTSEEVRDRARAGEGGPRRTYVARESLIESSAGATPHGLAGGQGYLDALALDPAADPTHRALLANAYVVRDLAAALRIAAEQPTARPLIVTLAGELVNALGAVTVGAAPDEAATLRHLREMREVEARIATLEADTDALGAALADARAAVLAADQEERRIESEQRTLAQETSRLLGEQRALTQQQLRVERDAAWWTEFAERAAAQLAELQERLRILESQRHTAEAAHRTAEARAAQVTTTEDQREAVLSSLRDRVSSARTDSALAEQRLAQAERDVEAARSAMHGAADELEAARERLVVVERELQQQSASAADAGERAGAAATALAQVETRFHAQTAEERALEDEIERHRTAHEAALTRAAEAERDRALLEAQRAALVERARALREQAERDLGELPEALADELGADALRARVDSLNNRLRSLGPVNQVAMQEHQEATERLAFLKRELADLNAAAASLEQVRAELDAGLQQDFGATFNAVAEHFRTYFIQLFGGGDAALRLTDPTNVAETGVEIIVQLPGKRKQELALLSGGERSLVAAALLFALLKAKPSPFCVLDEVDAALDEANVGRFCDALAELSAETQFVVVTHNRATMERAGALYGVTLGPDGISRVVSLKLQDAARANGHVAGNGAARTPELAARAN
ncbi:MAG TPA: chromosome segregation protein SMC [Chloroflexota bacterium]|nr:chromosome segregation protein SMC [Chloroflexota bacterium]